MKYLLVFITSLLIGYSDYWAGYYVSIFQPESFQAFLSLEKFEAPCDIKETEIARCTQKFIIPYQIIKNAEYFGSGKIISASKYYCKNKDSTPYYYDDIKNPGKRFDLHNTYQTVNLSSLNCKDDLVIEAWSKLSSIRVGYIGGNPVVGTYNQVEKQKKLSDFFSKDLTRILGFIFIMLFFLYEIVNVFFNKKILSNVFTSYLFYWLMFVLFASDIVQTVIPFTSMPLLFNKIVSFFSLSCHIGPVLEFTSSKSLKMKKILNLTEGSQKFLSLKRMVVFYFAIGILTPVWVKFFVFHFCLFAVVAIIYGLVEKQLIATLYGIVVAMTVMKIMNFSWMPNGMTTSYFVSFFLLISIFGSIKQISFIAQSIFSANDLIDAESLVSNIEDIERKIIKIIDVNQITFLQLSKHGGCQIRKYTRPFRSSTGPSRYSLEVFDKDVLPPVFAYVISNQKRLWHESQDSELIRNIHAKSEKRFNYSSDYMSILPLTSQGVVFGCDGTYWLQQEPGLRN